MCVTVLEDTPVGPDVVEDRDAPDPVWAWAKVSIWVLVVNKKV
jgi:hypothetical protein